ncbi:cytoskeleton-associated protein 2-like [Pholidichthys leucotaenia]
MEEAESEPVLSRKELRKQKLMEYLAAKGKLKLPNPKPYLKEDCGNKKTTTAALKVITGKENQAPTDKFRDNGAKVKMLSSQTRQDPNRRTFGVSNKDNAKGSKLIGQQKVTHPNRGPAQSKCDINPLLTRTYNIVSSKVKINAASHLKNYAKARLQPSAKASSNIACTVKKESQSKSRFCPNATSLSPNNMASVRMSFGPLIKTKTGLTPAVILPKTAKSNLTKPSAAAGYNSTSTIAARKVQSSHMSSVCVSQRSAMAVSSTRIAQNKVQNQNKPNSKPFLSARSQPFSKSQLPSAMKSTHVTTVKSMAAPCKPERRVTASKSAVEPANRSPKPRPKVKKINQPPKAAIQTSRPERKCNLRAVSRATETVVAKANKKTNTNKETDGKKEGPSTGATNPPQSGIKGTSAPVMSKTVPQPLRTISFTCQATNVKTPKIQTTVIAQTEGKKLTSAQEERLRKLQEWREAKGISYKRPPMQMKPKVRHTITMPQPFWASMVEEDEAHSLISAVDRSLADCIKLLEEGCPLDTVKKVLSRLPAVSQKFAKYWICQARLMEREGNLEVLPIFEKAVRTVLEPVDELRTVVFEILKKKDEIQASEANEEEEECIPTAENTEGNGPVMTPKPIRVLIGAERGDSSVVKYKITTTPGGSTSQKKRTVQVNGQEVRFFTPVRRSVRIERASLQYPASLQDHDLCVTSYNDLINMDEKEGSAMEKDVDTSPCDNNMPMYIYRENETLQDKVCVKFVCDDSD